MSQAAPPDLSVVVPFFEEEDAISTCFAIAGVQFLTFDLLAEIVARTWHESQDKFVYLARDVRGPG